MTDRNQNALGAEVFSGARRAAGYIEQEHTISRQAVDELLEQVAPSGSAEAAVEAEATGEPLPAFMEIPPMPQSAPRAAESTTVPDEVFLDPIVDLSEASTTGAPATASRGVRGLLSKVGIRLQPGAAERAQLEAAESLRRNEEVIRQATWTRAVSVLVCNKKGGTGKTPVSLLLGGTLAAIRGGSVAIIEVSDDPGALTFRAEGSPVRGMGELMREVEHITTAGQLAGYTAPQTSFASVIGTVGRRPRLTEKDVVAIGSVVDEFYGLRVMDSGNQPSSSAFQGAVATADALVIPVLNAGDAVLEAVALLEELRAAGDRASSLADHAVLIRLIDGRPEHPQVIERINRIIDGMHVGQVFTVPYDAHIAERGQLSVSKLSPATRAAFTAAAAGVVRALQGTVQ